VAPDIRERLKASA